MASGVIAVASPLAGRLQQYAALVPHRALDLQLLVLGTADEVSAHCSAWQVRVMQ